MKKFAATEGARGERLDNLFDLAGNDVARDKVVVVENGAEDTLGEDMLDEHFFDRLGGDVGVDGFLHHTGEIVKGADKFGVGLALVLDQA